MWERMDFRRISLHAERRNMLELVIHSHLEKWFAYNGIVKKELEGNFVENCCES